MDTNRLTSTCQSLRLDTVPKSVLHQIDNVDYNIIPFEQRLFEVLDNQLAANKAKKVSRLQKQANLRYPNLFPEDMDFQLYPKLKVQLFRQLILCEWITRKQHLLAIGSTGTGKTSLACIFAQAAIAMELPVLFYRLSNLLLELTAAQNEGVLVKFIKKLNRAALLVIDDWGNALMEKDERHLLFELIESRDGNGSLLITSQYPVEVWHESFNDSTIADSVLDRIVHNSHKIELKGESIRKMIGDKSSNISSKGNAHADK